MREYAFVRTENAIYRVFGHRHPDSFTVLLLRYYQENGEWRKPPVYAAESIDNAFLGRYDVPTTVIPQYGIRLGLGPKDPSAYLEYQDPLRVEDENIRSLSKIAQCEIGLSGSRLIGLNRSDSDLDLVLFGNEGIKGGKRLLEVVDKSAQGLKLNSTVISHFMKLNQGTVTRMTERNAYKGIIELDGRPVKLDIHYAFKATDISYGTLRTVNKFKSASIENLIVQQADNRYFFPGSLDCSLPSGEQCRVFINDHILGYLLPGDELSLHGLSISCPEETRCVVGQVVTALKLR